IDSHCWFYTPSSFLELMEGAVLLERFDFLLTHIEPTLEGEFEFFVSLEKPGRAEAREKLKMQQFELIQEKAKELATTLAEKLGLVGTLAVELFLTNEGKLLVNELAPRPHNSGHYTLDLCETSQFEQHIRAICGLP
ncbi:ATP-grasp domain-containing protein, partial [Heyndrickxia sporothermodurans]